MENKENNIAFIDGQNLKMGIDSSEISWEIDLVRFRIYLKEKFKVIKAYYYIGYKIDKYNKFYEFIKKAGFEIKFREHNSKMKGKKKGNVDADIIFASMKKLYKKENFDKIVLVSGDGDYKMLVDFLIEENKFKRILFPNKKFASSLYKNLGNELVSDLDNENIREKIKKQIR